MEMNVDNTKAMRISLNPIKGDKISKTTGKCGIFQIFG
jgi:hypothetical protein